MRRKTFAIFFICVLFSAAFAAEGGYVSDTLNLVIKDAKTGAPIRGIYVHCAEYQACKPGFKCLPVSRGEGLTNDSGRLSLRVIHRSGMPTVRATINSRDVGVVAYPEAIYNDLANYAALQVYLPFSGKENSILLVNKKDAYPYIASDKEEPLSLLNEKRSRALQDLKHLRGFLKSENCHLDNIQRVWANPEGKLVIQLYRLCADRQKAFGYAATDYYALVDPVKGELRDVYDNDKNLDNADIAQKKDWLAFLAGQAAAVPVEAGDRSGYGMEEGY